MGARARPREAVAHLAGVPHDGLGPPPDLGLQLVRIDVLERRRARRLFDVYLHEREREAPVRAPLLRDNGVIIASARSFRGGGRSVVGVEGEGFLGGYGGFASLLSV